MVQQACVSAFYKLFSTHPLQTSISLPREDDASIFGKEVCFPVSVVNLPRRENICQHDEQPNINNNNNNIGSDECKSCFIHEDSDTSPPVVPYSLSGATLPSVLADRNTRTLTEDAGTSSVCGVEASLSSCPLVASSQQDWQNGEETCEVIEFSDSDMSIEIDDEDNDNYLISEIVVNSRSDYEKDASHDVSVTATDVCAAERVSSPDEGQFCTVLS